MITSRIATLDTENQEPLRLNYLESTPPTTSHIKGCILLIHGFPQTSHQFRHVLPAFADAGYHVIAPDYRGAGASSKPMSGYTKTQMAQDLHKLLHSHLQVAHSEPLHIIGHDVGGMIAHAYATSYPSEVSSVIWGECPLPGTSFFDALDGTSLHFHFVFHRILDLPEALIAGREYIYLKHFFDKLSYNSSAIGNEGVEHYTTCFSQPGAIRCGVNLYRAFDQDAKENRECVEKNGKCKVKCLILNGVMGQLRAGADAMGKEMYENAEVATVADAGHYVAEENPEGFVQAVLKFLEKIKS